MASRSERFSGTLASWNDERGYGFVTPLGRRGRVFVHIGAFPRGAARPLVGDALTFAIEHVDGKDRATAVSSSRPVRFVAGREERPTRRAASPVPGNVALVAFAALYLAVWATTGLPVWVSVLYLALSVLSFVVYAVDKSAAKRARRRVPEKALHLMALAGGWPGAIVAQQALRHKTAKRSFRRVFWLTVVVNVAGFVALATPALANLLA